MAKPTIVIPTHGRAGRVTTHKVVEETILCVAESQLPLYKAEDPDLEYEVHPDDVVGLAAKRDWIANRFGDVFMLDDDVTACLDLTSVGGHIDKIPPAHATARIYRTHQEAEDLGIYLYGYAPIADCRTFKALNPYRFRGYVPGHSFGLRAGHGLWWHHDCIQEDYWICALNAYFHRMAIRDDRMSFTQRDTFKGVGGLGAHRTIGKEKEGFELLQKHFGNVIRHRTPKMGQTNGKLAERQASHPWQPTLKLPY